jgi:intracellular multiplication protein IcmP
MGMIWTVAAIFVFGAITWYIFKTQIIGFYFTVKLWEIKILGLFTNNLMDVQTYIKGSNPDKLTFDDIVKVGEAVGDYLRYPLVLIIIVMAIIVFTANSTRIFKKIYSMKDLATVEKVNWPQITPIILQDLANKDIDKGPWAMALTPMQFCKKNNLLQEYRRAPVEGMSHKDRNKIEVSLKRGNATKIFAVQLGQLWPGINRVPPHVKALFGAFAARVNGDSQAAAVFRGKTGFFRSR